MTQQQQLNRRSCGRGALRDAGDSAAALDGVRRMMIVSAREIEDEIRDLKGERRRILIEGTEPELLELDDRLQELETELVDVKAIGEEAKRRAGRAQVDEAIKDAPEALRAIPDTVRRLVEAERLRQAAQESLVSAVQRWNHCFHDTPKSRRQNDLPAPDPNLLNRVNALLANRNLEMLAPVPAMSEPAKHVVDFRGASVASGIGELPSGDARVRRSEAQAETEVEAQERLRNTIHSWEDER